MKIASAVNASNELENESLDLSKITAEEIPLIETNNAAALENLLCEANRSTACSSKSANGSGMNQNVDAEDVIWLDEPPMPMILPHYALAKRDGDRFSGNAAFREMVNNYN